MPCPPRFDTAPVTNIRNTKSAHWRRGLGRANRCVVPFTSFCEHTDTRPEKNADVVRARGGSDTRAIRGAMATVLIRLSFSAQSRLYSRHYIRPSSP